MKVEATKWYTLERKQILHFSNTFFRLHITLKPRKLKTF